MAMGLDGRKEGIIIISPEKNEQKKNGRMKNYGGKWEDEEWMEEWMNEWEEDDG
jgi:hypothetical protein